MKKLSFGNALFNTGSQDLCKSNKNSEDEIKQIIVHHPTSNESTKRGILKHRVQTSNSDSGENLSLVKPNNKSKRKLRWADGKQYLDCKLITALPALCKVKEIPLEIRQRAGPELGTQVDKGSIIRNYNLSNKNNSTPRAISSSAWLNHDPSFNAREAFVPNTCGITNEYLQYGTQKMDTSRVLLRRQILDKIIRWMPQWLEEQKLQRDEPEVTSVL